MAAYVGLSLQDSRADKSTSEVKTNHRTTQTKNIDVGSAMQIYAGILCIMRAVRSSAQRWRSRLIGRQKGEATPKA